MTRRRPRDPSRQGAHPEYTLTVSQGTGDQSAFVTIVRAWRAWRETSDAALVQVIERPADVSGDELAKFMRDSKHKIQRTLHTELAEPPDVRFVANLTRNPIARHLDALRPWPEYVQVLTGTGPIRYDANIKKVHRIDLLAEIQGFIQRKQFTIPKTLPLRDRVNRAIAEVQAKPAKLETQNFVLVDATEDDALALAVCLGVSHALDRPGLSWDGNLAELHAEMDRTVI